MGNANCTDLCNTKKGQNMLFFDVTWNLDTSTKAYLPVFSLHLKTPSLILFYISLLLLLYIVTPISYTKQDKNNHHTKQRKQETHFTKWKW